jgi:hypothetical protein
MRGISINGLLALAAGLLLMANPASGEMSRVDLCNAYADEAIKIAGRVRELACGFDFGHPQWSQDRGIHFNWCVDSRIETIDHERDERRNKLSRCGECRDYATAAAFQGRLNEELKCGFSGPQWSRDPAPHFGWCMDLKPFVPDSTWHPFVIFGASPVQSPETEDPHLTNEDGARSQAIEECRLRRQKPQNCKVCHGGSSQVSSAQDVYRALSPGKSDNRRRALPAAKPVATARTPSSSSGVDTVNPSKPKPKMVAPGLLEGDAGFSTQGGPARAGAGAGAAGGGGAGGGGGVGVSTFRSPSNMTAPPAGGGLR